MGRCVGSSLQQGGVNMITYQGERGGVTTAPTSSVMLHLG